MRCLGWVSLLLVVSSSAHAGTWGESWGSMVGGAVAPAVPSLGGVGGALLVALLVGLAWWRPKSRRAVAALGLLLALTPSPVAEAQGVDSILLTSFSNGSVADADEVNANFAALVAAVQELQAATQMFLTMDACPAGYDSVEDGYIKLGSTGLTTTASSRTLVNPAHTHSHSLQTDTYAGHGALDFPVPHAPQSPVTGGNLGYDPEIGEGAHSHNITGTVGSGSVSGDTAQAITGDLEHITLRLCVRTQ